MFHFDRLGGDQTCQLIFILKLYASKYVPANLCYNMQDTIITKTEIVHHYNQGILPKNWPFSEAVECRPMDRSAHPSIHPSTKASSLFRPKSLVGLDISTDPLPFLFGETFFHYNTCTHCTHEQIFLPPTTNTLYQLKKSI